MIASIDFSDEAKGTPFLWPEGRRAALSLTFDDTRDSQFDAGAPILNQYEIRASFYASLITAEKRRNDWRAMTTRGHEIGAHLMRHPCSGNTSWSRKSALENYTLEQMENEMEESDRRIEALTGRAPETFAYPCGQTFVGRGEETRSYVPLVARRYVAGRTFRNEWAADPGFCDLAQLPAYDGDGLAFEDMKVIIEKGIERGAWVIFAFHDVCHVRPQAITPETLDKLCRFAAERADALWTAPLGKVVKTVTGLRK